MELYGLYQIKLSQKINCNYNQLYYLICFRINQLSINDSINIIITNKI